MQQQIISRTDCDVWQKVDFIWQPAMTSLVVGLRRNSKALAKAKLAPKNVTVIVWWSATSLSHYSFLNPGENITSEKYAQQMRCTENCSAHSWHWSTERAQFFSMTTPSVGTTNTSKVGRIGQSFAPSTISTWPLTNRLSLLQTSWQHFERKMLPQPGEDRKCYPRVHWILKHGFLCCRNKQTFLIDK